MENETSRPRDDEMSNDIRRNRRREGGFNPPEWKKGNGDKIHPRVIEEGGGEEEGKGRDGRGK